MNCQLPGENRGFGQALFLGGEEGNAFGQSQSGFVPGNFDQEPLEALPTSGARTAQLRRFGLCLPGRSKQTFFKMKKHDLFTQGPW